MNKKEMETARKRPLVIYHRNCFDGFTAAWVWRKFKGDNADFVSMNHGESPPDCMMRPVWLVDFSFKREVMLDSVIIPSLYTYVFDHHKTAEVELDGILEEIKVKRNLVRSGDKIVFDMNRSGSGILYDYLELEKARRDGRREPRFNNQRPCWLVDYVEDRDIWKWGLEDSKEVSAWISTIPMTFEAWDNLEEEGLKMAAEKGRSVLKYIDQFGEKLAHTARFENIAGYSVPTITVPYMNSSDHINRLLDVYPNAQFAAGYFRRSDGLWQFGLRSKGEFDVSEIAKLFGGGGHRNASGFQSETLPWERTLVEKDNVADFRKEGDEEVLSE